MAVDYIEFLRDLKVYLYGNLSFISPSRSYWKDVPQIFGDKRYGSTLWAYFQMGNMKLPYEYKLFFKHWPSKDADYTFL